MTEPMTGDYTAQTEKIGKAFDVNTALKEAVEFGTKNSFQEYVAEIKRTAK